MPGGTSSIQAVLIGKTNSTLQCNIALGALGALGALICTALRCCAISRLSASVRHFCIGTQNLRWYVLRVVNQRWNAERRATPPTYAVRFLVSVETYDRRLALLSTHRLRTNATPHSASTIKAVWFCVFRWNARRTTS